MEGNNEVLYMFVSSNMTGTFLIFLPFTTLDGFPSTMDISQPTMLGYPSRHPTSKLDVESKSPTLGWRKITGTRRALATFRTHEIDHGFWDLLKPHPTIRAVFQHGFYSMVSLFKPSNFCPQGWCDSTHFF